MKEKTYNAIDCPDGSIIVVIDDSPAILTLTPFEALELSSCLKNAVNNHAIDLMRLIKES